MFPYLFLIGIPAFISTITREKYSKNKKGNIVISMFFFLLIVILALRGADCGNDTMSYKYFFEISKRTNWGDIFNIDMEYGYAIFQKVISVILPDYQCFLGIVAVISVLPVWLFYRKVSEMSLLSIALFVAVAPFSMYFSGVRQVIAMAFAIPAFYFAIDRKLIQFLLIAVFAFLFHRSAFILLLLYPICRIKITKKWLWFAIPVIGIVFIFNEQIFTFLMIFINDFYTGEVTYTGAYTILLLLIIFAIYSYVVPDESKLDDETIMLRNILLLAVCMQCFASINPLAMRMNYYFLIFIPILIPKIVRRCKTKYKRMVKISILVMMVFFTTYFFINISSGGGLNIYPYVPFWR